MEDGSSIEVIFFKWRRRWKCLFEFQVDILSNFNRCRYTWKNVKKRHSLRHKPGRQQLFQKQTFPHWKTTHTHVLPHCNVKNYVCFFFSCGFLFNFLYNDQNQIEKCHRFRDFAVRLKICMRLLRTFKHFWKKLKRRSSALQWSKLSGNCALFNNGNKQSYDVQKQCIKTNLSSDYFVTPKNPKNVVFLPLLWL